jgi:hypothetical protein
MEALKERHRFVGFPNLELSGLTGGGHKDKKLEKLIKSVS